MRFLIFFATFVAFLNCCQAIEPHNDWEANYQNRSVRLVRGAMLKHKASQAAKAGNKLNDMYKHSQGSSSGGSSSKSSK